MEAQLIFTGTGKNWEKWTTPRSAIDVIWVIMDMKQDKDGVLWLAGMSPSWKFGKFENNAIQTIPGVNTYAYGLEIDNDNNIWLATNAGLVKYDRATFTTYDISNSTLPANTIHDVKKDVSGNLWLTCNKYLVKYDGSDFTKYEIPQIRENAMKLLPDGDVIWVGTKRNQLFKFKDGEFTHIELSNSPLITNEIALDMTIDGENNVWFGTRYNLTKIDANDNWHSLYRMDDIPPNAKRVSSSATDREGNVWITLGESDTIVMKISKSGTKAFTSQNSLLFRGMYAGKFCFDKKGNTWLTSRAGLYKYDGANWQRFTPLNSPLTDYLICELATDNDDNLWGAVGTEAGCLFKYDGTDWTIYTTANSELPTRFVANVAFDSKNTLWVHCRDKDNVIGGEYGGGLTRFDGVSWTTYNMDNSGIPANSILDIEIDRNDNLWLATSGRVGVTYFNGDTWTQYNIFNSGIAFDEVSKITLDYHRDLVWFSHTMGSGISTAKMNFIPTGIEQNLSDSKNIFSIYPNPASTTIQFNITLEYVEIYDISGKLIAARQLKGNKTLSLQELNILHDGLYLVKAVTQNGTYTQRLMVKR
ncbi:MAG: two-component regulator propeller domain-containing protein [Dysgonomonas sp.]